MAFKDREEFLDALYDHIFPEKDYPDGPDDEDENFFEHVAKFFPESEGGSNDSGGTNPPRRRRSSGQSGGSSGPRRRRRSSSAASGSGYGSQAFFGTR